MLDGERFLITRRHDRKPGRYTCRQQAGSRCADGAKNTNSLVAGVRDKTSGRDRSTILRRRNQYHLGHRLVGDIAQATGAWANDDWHGVLDELGSRRPPSFAQLTVGYRLPQPTMDVAARVLRHAAPQLDPPVAVRDDGDEPRFVAVDTPARRPRLRPRGWAPKPSS